jgi:hypothetical protein
LSAAAVFAAAKKSVTAADVFAAAKKDVQKRRNFSISFEVFFLF